MTSRFDQTDLSKIKAIPIADRYSKVSVDDIVDPRSVLNGEPVSGAQLLDAFPDILAASSLKRVVRAIRKAKENNREVLWLIGAHTIKVGLSKYLNALMDDGYITGITTTGSSTIHDLELSFFGKTSEDVGAELPAGRFGMSAETASHYNAMIRHAAEADLGLGEGMGDYLETHKAPNREASVFRNALVRNIPATVHIAFGTDITHQHPGFPAALAGELTMRDFRIFTDRVGRMLDGGVVVICGSAVNLPEVFLKAVSINYNLGLKPSDVTAVAFDMLPQYRVRENVLVRPFKGAGEGHTITGHHEIMLPLLYFLLSN
jgi:hypothetical protein